MTNKKKSFITMLATAILLIAGITTISIKQIPKSINEPTESINEKDTSEYLSPQADTTVSTPTTEKVDTVTSAKATQVTSTKIRTTVKNNNQSTPPPATVTQAIQEKAPIGSNKDMNPEPIKQAVLEYMSSLKGVRINTNLNKGNSCWTGYTASYHLTPEKFENKLKEIVMIEYRDNVRYNSVGNGHTLEMYIVYDIVTDEYYGEELDYYYFYILSMIT